MGRGGRPPDSSRTGVVPGPGPRPAVFFGGEKSHSNSQFVFHKVKFSLAGGGLTNAQLTIKLTSDRTVNKTVNN